jgi:DNA-binding transcriptional LysR family regulator
MQLRDVEIFRTVMNAGSASKASALLGITQPAVSQAIRRLESSAALPLFARVRGRLQPLPEARAFLLEVDRCFIGLETLQHRLASLRTQGVNRLTVASYPALGISFLPRVIAAMVAARPGLHVSLQVVSSREVREGVLAGQCDFGLLADELPMSGMEHSTLFEVNAMVAMPTRHRLARKTSVSVDDFLAHPIVALNPEDASRRRLAAALKERAAEVLPVVETPYSVSVCELVLEGVGIGLVNPLVALAYRDRGLVVRPFAEGVPFRCLLAIPPGRPMSAVGREFLSTLRVQIAQHLKSLPVSEVKQKTRVART